MNLPARLLRSGARLLFRIYFRVEITGLAGIPADTPFIIAANHSSYLDPLIIGCFCPRPVRFLMLESFYNKPFLKWFFRLYRAIPVARSGSDISGIRKSIEALKNGDVLGIFPEGRRSPDGSVTEPMPGVGLIASKTEMPVIPAGINGAHGAFPKGAFLPRPSKITLNFGESLSPAGFTSPVKDMPSIIMKRIEELALLPENPEAVEDHRDR